MFPFYDYNNDLYCSFMIKLMIYLEPRQFNANEMIYEELEDANEILFVTKGRYDIGYVMNRTVKYRLQITDRTCIGGFNMVFNRRFQNRCRAHT